jgi:Asp-tRNA(Asn)/Glu-tRNA(Gln) amidotransferase A subunit family amidase
MTPDRRELLATLTALSIGPATFQRAVAAQAAQNAVTKVTPEMLKDAEWIAGVTLSDDERTRIANALTNHLRQASSYRRVDLPNNIPPAFQFNPAPTDQSEPARRGFVETPKFDITKPESDDDLAFLSVAQLAQLIRTKQVSSVELTMLYLKRLQTYDPILKCVISLTDDLALKQARRADEEIAAGKYRGPLHGIPWGAKDLMAVPGYKTTWGAAEYQEQTLDITATVAERLEQAGAVLVAKLSLGALAYNDVWFGGRTNNPWNIQQGSSGSSAGSAAAVAAGLVGFAIGSETYGSIVSPSSRCGVTGLRPTFGRVSRHGCMTLCWTLDKIGPMARTAVDCAVVLGAIHGADGRDPTTVDRPFVWPSAKPLKELKVGYVPVRKGDVERAELQVLRELGVTLVPITLPNQRAGVIMETILMSETGAAFDSLIRSGKLDGIGALWPTSFRMSQFITAVDYIRANRLRTQLMQDMAKVMEAVDLYVGGNDLAIANLTGHPTVCLPNGFRAQNDSPPMPTALTFTGRLYGEAELLTLAAAYQQATGHHLKRPPLEMWLEKKRKN